MRLPKWASQTFCFATYTIKFYWLRMLLTTAVVGSLIYSQQSALSQFQWPLSKPVWQRIVKAPEARPKAAAIPRKVSAEDRIVLRKLQQQTVNIDFVEAPLDRVIEFFRSVTGLGFHVSKRAWESSEEGSLEFNLRLLEVPVADVLDHLMSGSREFCWKVDGGLVVIDFIESHEEDFVLEFYDLSDILDYAKERNEYADSVIPEPEASGNVLNFGDGNFSCCVDCDELAELLSAVISEADDCSLDIVGNVLIAYSSPRTHAKLELCLEAIRVSFDKGPGSSTIPTNDLMVNDGEEAVKSDQDLLWKQQYKNKLATTRLNVEWRDTPLSVVLETLREDLKLNIVVSPEIDAEELTIRMELKNVPASKILDLALDPFEISYVLTNRAIVLVTEEDRGSWGPYSLQIYNVQNIVDPNEDGESSVDRYTLEEIISDATGEDHWEGPAFIRSFQGLLFVFQRPAINRAVDKVIRALDQAMDR